MSIATRPATGTAPGPTSHESTPRRRRLRWDLPGLYVGLIAIAIFCLAPFYWMVVSSLKAPNEIFDNSLIPRHPTLMNYEAVFGAQNTFVLALRNSLIIAGCVTVVALVFGVIAAYAIARLNFRGKNLVLGLFLATSMFPGVAILTPLFQLFADWGWIDTYQAMIVPDISFSQPNGNRGHAATPNQQPQPPVWSQTPQIRFETARIAPLRPWRGRSQPAL
ncbi:MAG: carbohydrate ABC transporter permease [Cellulomonas sp.]|nr:carbohydrate ABC transporter permease [Cellulomonas sp.]